MAGKLSTELHTTTTTTSSSSSSEAVTTKTTTTIDDLPFLAIEYILSQLSYYQLLQLRLISRRWYTIVQEYLTRADRNFLTNLINYRVQWVAVKQQVESNVNSSIKSRTIPRMSPRIHHLACYVDNYMYVYGGCISFTTTYNDLWRFDTTTKHWSRIIPEGTLPLPHLFGSLSLYNCYDDDGSRKQYLVLFGGIIFNDNLQSPTLEDPRRVLKTIHLFDIESNRWTLINVKGSIELKCCHHTATVVGDELIVGCNGYGFVNERPILVMDQALYVFDLKKHYWRRQRTIGSFPHAIFRSPRLSPQYPSIIYPIVMLETANELLYSSSFTTPNSFIIDDHHILFITHLAYHSFKPFASLLKLTGRCKSWPNCVQCNHLNIDDNNHDDNGIIWQWQSVDLSNIGSDSKCGNICMIKNRLLAYLSVKNQLFHEPKSKIIYNLNNNNCNNHNKRLSSLSTQQSHQNTKILKQLEKRERRIEKLEYYKRYYENRMHRNNQSNENDHHNINDYNGRHFNRITLQLNLLDISELLTNRRITKIRSKCLVMDYDACKPNVFNHHSLVSTPESLILFGGYFSEKNIQNKLFLLVSKPKSSV